jgi:chromosome segregation ATPase
LHDALLEIKPEGVVHDEFCPFCTEAASEQEEEDVTDQAILNEEQHEQLLASAVEKALEEASASTDKEILRLNTQLEEAEKALVEKDTEIEGLKSTITDREEDDRLEALASERVELVQAVANFSDEQIDARKASWAKMDDEVFEDYLGDIKTALAAAEKPKGEEPPKSSFDGTRVTAGEEGTEMGAVKSFLTGLSSAQS